MAYLFHPDALLAAVSGVALATLGFATLRVRPRRPGQLAFSAFACLWGAQIVAANVSRMADPAHLAFWTFLFVALAIPLYVPLLAFALTHPWTPPSLRGRRGWLLALAAPALLMLVVLAVAPAAFIRSVEVSPTGARIADFGPLFRPASLWNGVLAFAVALVLVARRQRASRGEAEREQLGLVAAALLVYVSYQAATLAGLVAGQGGAFLAALGPWVGAAYGAALVVSVGVVVGVAGSALRATGPWRRLTLACAILPFAMALVEAVSEAGGLPTFDTIGLWRLAMVGLFAYAVARHRMFDVEVRLQGLAPAATAIAAGLGGLVLLWAAAGPFLAGSPALGLAASAGVVALCAPLPRVSRGALERAAPQLAEADFLYRRRLDVYRAAVEESRGHDPSDRTEQEFLTELRHDLGISDQEHRLMLLLLESQHRARAATPPLADARFHVVRELGRGAFGRALLARDAVLGREVVLKEPLDAWLLGTGRERFLQEARLAARVTHPNVVAVHEVVLDHDPPLMVLEYVPGGSLDERLAPTRALPAPEAVKLTLDVLAGLEAIHAEGIVHRDLKPGNILVDARGVAKVTDFGIAHPPPELALAATVATSGSQPGSLAYMAPEQVEGKAADARADLYAVGVLLYRMLTGSHYLDIRGLSPLEVQRKVLEAPPLLPAPNVSAVLEAVLRRALAKDPAARFPSAAAMAKALRETQSRLGDIRTAPAR